MGWTNIDLTHSISQDVLAISGNLAYLRSAFASDTAPANPVTGQIFYKIISVSPALYEKYEYNGDVWVKVLDSGALIPDALIPSPFTTPGGRKVEVVTLSGNTILDLDNHVIFVDATSGIVLLTLPSAVTYQGACFLIKKVDSSGNVVTLSGTQNIDGSSTATLSSQYSFAYLISDGTQWMLFSS